MILQRSTNSIILGQICNEAIKQNILFPTQFDNTTEKENYTGAFNFHQTGVFTNVEPIDIKSAYPTT